MTELLSHCDDGLSWPAAAVAIMFMIVVIVWFVVMMKDLHR